MTIEQNFSCDHINVFRLFNPIHCLVELYFKRVDSNLKWHLWSKWDQQMILINNSNVCFQFWFWYFRISFLWFLLCWFVPAFKRFFILFHFYIYLMLKLFSFFLSPYCCIVFFLWFLLGVSSKSYCFHNSVFISIYFLVFQPIFGILHLFFNVILSEQLRLLWQHHLADWQDPNLRNGVS